ncbi:MAG: flagellar assembly protein FliH [Devosia sp.]
MTPAPAATPTKFTFDLDLGRRQERNALITETAMAAMLAKARAEGYQQGLTEGERAHSVEAARRLAAAAEMLAANSAAMNAALDDRTKQTLSEAIELASTIGRKLAAHLLAAQPTRELDALLAECLASLEGLPHLVIRCAPDLADAIREIATARIEASGFAGRLVVMGDPEQAPGDGRIEWVDGGLVRDRASIERDIDTRIAAFLAAKNIHGPSTVVATARENDT